MSKQKIVSIEIQLTDYEPIRFTMAEAKELHEQLHDLFGDKEQHTHFHTNPWYSRPYYTWYNASNAVGTPRQVGKTITIAGQSDFVGKSVTSNNTNMKVSFLSS